MAAPWVPVLAEPDVRRALEQAFRSFMQLACSHQHRNHNGRPTNDPTFCDCLENRVTPLEVLDWIDDETRMADAPPVRFEVGARPYAEKRAAG